MSDREEMLALADKLDFAANNTEGCLYSQRKMLHDAATALRSTARTGPDVAGFEACREACKRAVFSELLQDCTGTPDDIAYNNAIHCALDAIAALPAPATASADWQTMDSAPKDGRAIAVICWWPSYTDDKPGKWNNPETYRYEQDPQREQCWIDVHRSSCIREDRFIERYRWAPLPTDLPPAPTITRKSQSEERS